MSSYDNEGNPTNEAFIKWRNENGFTSKTRDEIIDIGINALIKESNHQPWNLIRPTDVEVVDWMYSNKNTLSTIYNIRALDNFTIILEKEIQYLDDVDRGFNELDGNNRLFTKNDAIEMKSILEANYPPNLLKLFKDGPPANGGYRRRNKRSKKQSKKSKKSRRSKKSKKSRKSKTSRRL
jgi:hypothetical protein